MRQGPVVVVVVGGAVVVVGGAVVLVGGAVVVVGEVVVVEAGAVVSEPGTVVSEPGAVVSVCGAVVPGPGRGPTGTGVAGEAGCAMSSIPKTAPLPTRAPARTARSWTSAETGWPTLANRVNVSGQTTPT